MANLEVHYCPKYHRSRVVVGLTTCSHPKAINTAVLSDVTGVIEIPQGLLLHACLTLTVLKKKKKEI